MSGLTNEEKNQQFTRLVNKLAQWNAKLDESETEWKGDNAYYLIVCPNGHHISKTAHGIIRGYKCAKCRYANMQTTDTKIELFNSLKIRLQSWGAKLDDSETEWKGAKAYYSIICPNGHSIMKSANTIKMGHGCQICQGVNHRNSLLEYSEDRYRQHLISIGATPEWTEWKGEKYPHDIVCPYGHKTNPRPDSILNARSGICKTCSHRDSAEQRSIDKLAIHGAIPLWDKWYGIAFKHRVQCSNGHIIYVRPHDVNSGQGPCSLCANKIWDVFYVVHDAINYRYKLGITSVDERPRIKVHKLNGYTDLMFLASDIDAKLLEDEILRILNDNGYHPFKGREYFTDESLEFLFKELKEYNLINEVENK